MKTNDRLALCNRLSFHNHWLVLAFCLAGTVVHAANRTWDGGGADGYWSMPANWDGDATAPVSGDALFFGGTNQLYNTNDLTASTSFAGITFNTNAGVFVITGAAITLGGDVTNKSPNLQTLSLPMDLNATRTFTTPSPYLGYITVGGDLSGAGGLIKSGTRGLTLSGSNTFTGGVTMNDGILNLYGVSAFKGGLTIKAGTANLTNSFSGIGGVVSVYSNAFLKLGPGTLTNDIVNNGTVSYIDKSGTLTLSGLISGTGNLEFQFNMTDWILSQTNNSYTGKTTVTGNAATYVLQVSKLANGGQNSSIGASSSAASNLVLAIGGGAGGTYLRYVGPGDTTDRLLTLKSSSGPIGIENNGTGPLSFTSTGSISNSTANKTNTFSLGGSYAGEANTFAPSIVENGNGIRLAKAGAGIWALSGANTYSGGTTVSGGILTYLNTPAKPASSNTTVAASCALGLGVGGTGYFSATDVDALYANTLAAVTMNAASGVGIDTSAGDFTYATSQANDRALHKLGANILTLTGNNSNTKGATVWAGTLVVSNANALGTSGTIAVKSNATLAVAAGVTFSRQVAFTNGAALAGQGAYITNNWTTPTGLIIAPGLPTGTLTVDVGGTGKTLTLGVTNTLRIAFQPDGSCGKLSVTGALDISNPTARLVLTGKPPAGKTVLAEGTTLNGTFLEGNIDMTGLNPKGVIKYENNKVILAYPSRGTVVTIR